MLVERPNKISFRYDPPNKNRIVSDGTTLKVYIAEDSQMFVTPVQNTEYPGALAFMMGAASAERSRSRSTTRPRRLQGRAGARTASRARPTPHYESVFFYVDKALLDKGGPRRHRSAS